MNKKTYLYWPVRMEWKSRAYHDERLVSWFTWHGWQAGWYGVGHGVFGWTFHMGRLIVLFGKDIPRPTAKVIPFPERAA